MSSAQVAGTELLCSHDDVTSMSMAAEFEHPCYRVCTEYGKKESSLHMIALVPSLV